MAEGIEEGEDYKALPQLVVKYGQGYLFGRPEACESLPTATRKKEAAANDRLSSSGSASEFDGIIPPDSL